MLRLMHRYKKSLFGFLLVGLVVMAMSGFGVRMLDKHHEPFAVKIDDHIVTYEQLSQERRGIEERYRSAFGKNYPKMMEQLGLNANQQAVDKVINDYLLEREAGRLNLVVGDDSLGSLIKLSLFGRDRPFDAQAYRGFLRQLGMTSKQFEDQLRGDALRQQYAGILRLASFPSLREVRMGVEREESKFGFTYAEFDPASFVKDLKDPEPAVLEAFYKDRGERYELPPRVSYDYLVLDPEKFLDLVEVTPEDIELYYSDHQADFMTGEQIKARHIQLNYDKKATAEQMAALKEKAEQVHQKVLAGESFDSLALEYSDDITTKGNGGSLGWISKGVMSKQFDAAAFKLHEGGVTDLVQTDYGFHIVKVEDFKPSAPRELAEVRSQIDTLLRKREAPAYTSEKAHSLFEQWQNGTMSLANFAVTNNLAAASTVGMLDKDKDPDDKLRGLTAKVLAFPEEEKQTVDVGDKTVLVAVKQYRDQEVPALEQVKAKVVQDWKQEQSKIAAKTAAKSLLASAQASPDGALKTAAQAGKTTLKEAKDLSMSAKARSTPFNNPDVARAVFNADAVGQKPTEVFESDGKYYLIQPVSVVKPDAAVIEAKVSEYRKRGADSFLQTMVAATVTDLKARSAIETAPGLLSSES